MCFRVKHGLKIRLLVCQTHFVNNNNYYYYWWQWQIIPMIITTTTVFIPSCGLLCHKIGRPYSDANSSLNASNINVVSHTPKWFTLLSKSCCLFYFLQDMDTWFLELETSPRDCYVFNNGSRLTVSYMYAAWSSVSHLVCCQETADNCGIRV